MLIGLDLHDLELAHVGDVLPLRCFQAGGRHSLPSEIAVYE